MALQSWQSHRSVVRKTTSLKSCIHKPTQLNKQNKTKTIQKKKRTERTLCSISHAVLESHHLLSFDEMAEGKENDGQVEPEKKFG